MLPPTCTLVLPADHFARFVVVPASKRIQVSSEATTLAISDLQGVTTQLTIPTGVFILNRIQA